jgi:RHS repeat-associated protein
VRHELAEESEIQNWFGGLVDGMRDASGLMYMRNRYYNPASGQFTQPDPIGLAGGLNTYGFAAGDPVGFSDPYGLAVCYKGTAQEVKRLQRATEEATGAALYLDQKNCVRAVGNTMNAGLTGLRNRLELMRARPTVYNVGFSYSADRTWVGSACDNYIISHYCPIDDVVEIYEGDIGRRLPADSPACWPIGAFGMGQHMTENLPSIIAHELLGHAWSAEIATGYSYDDSERIGVIAENNYNRTRPGGRKRCVG